jgi:transglutaminase-like putative cysteine protease
VAPWPSVSREHQDLFGNHVSYFSIQRAHSTLEIAALSEIETAVPVIPEPSTTPPWERVRDQLRYDSDPLYIQARIFTLPSPASPKLAAPTLTEPHFTPQRPVLEAVLGLMQTIFTRFAYDPSFTTIATPVIDVLEHQRGVCQDFAHLAIAVLRNLGLAARYVSGYLETQPPPGQPKLRGADASHAWFSVLVPGYGWIDFDPTNNILLGEHHITVAIGRDYHDVAPVRGVFYGGGEHVLHVSVDVERCST